MPGLHEHCKKLGCEYSCGEGIYPRWAAQQPLRVSGLTSELFGAASRPSGDKSPRHS